MQKSQRNINLNMSTVILDMRNVTGDRGQAKNGRKREIPQNGMVPGDGSRKREHPGKMGDLTGMSRKEQGTAALNEQQRENEGRDFKRRPNIT